MTKLEEKQEKKDDRERNGNNDDDDEELRKITVKSMRRRWCRSGLFLGLDNPFEIEGRAMHLFHFSYS